MAGVAQSVEQLTRNEKVGGSIPLSGTSIKKARISLRAFLLWLAVQGLQVDMFSAYILGTPFAATRI